LVFISGSSEEIHPNVVLIEFVQIVLKPISTLKVMMNINGEIGNQQLESAKKNVLANDVVTPRKELFTNGMNGKPFQIDVKNTEHARIAI
jgi:hypothetical protein